MSIFLIENEKAEEQFDVVFWPFRENHHIWTDTEITPAYCTHCRRQVDGMFAYLDSHSGQVGTLSCNHCGSIIYCTDKDPYHHQLIMTTLVPYASLVIDFAKLYLLHPKVFYQIQMETGYDVFAQGKKVKLSRVVEELCHQIDLPITQLPRIQIITDLHFPCLPTLVNRWLNLLRTINIT